MIPVWGEVARDVPPLTRPGPDDWERLDVDSVTEPLFDGEDLIVDDDEPVVVVTPVGSHVSGVRDLSTSRGADMRSGAVEAGRAFARVDNRFGQLDGLKTRRRVRFVAQPEGEDPRVLWTGYIDRHPRKWGVNDGWRDLQCVGLLGLIAERPLPPSVLQAETIASAPISYWPLTETSGRVADDVVGTADGVYRRQVTGTSRLMPFDARENAMMSPPTKEDSSGQMVAVRQLSGSPEMTISFWVACGDPLSARTVWVHAQRNTGGRTGNAQARLWLGVGIDGVVVLVEDASDNSAIVRFPFHGLVDRQPHHVAVRVDAANQLLEAWVDGHQITLPEDGAQVDYSNVDLDEMAANLHTAGIGFGVTVPPEEAGDYETAAVGHVAFWDRLLTPEEIEGLYRAGVQAWAGDTTGQRLHRVLDLAGIDPDDRLIDTGTQTCGPTFLGGNVRTYLEKLAATEQGSISEDAEGRIRFRQRPPNQPVPVATYTGAPKDEPGVPYLDIELDDGIDRLVNIAQVTRENGVTHTATDPVSEEEYGPVSVRLDTLHQSASGARSTAARLVIRNREPRQIITGLTVAGHDEVHVPAEAWLDVEIGDAVEVLCQPTGSTPFRQLSIVERIEYHARKTGERVMVLGLVEHQVLPCFALDDPDAGLDQSVMCEAPMEVA